MQNTFTSKNIEKTFEVLTLNEQYIDSDMTEKFEQLKQSVSAEYHNIICR